MQWRSSADPPSTFSAPVGFAPTDTLTFHCTCLLVYKLSCLLKQKSISIPDGKSTLPSEDISISRLEWQVLSFWPLMNTWRPQRGCFHLGRDMRRLWRLSLWVGSTLQETWTRTRVIKMQIAGKACAAQAPTPYTLIIHSPPVAKSGSGRLHSDADTEKRERECMMPHEWNDIYGVFDVSYWIIFKSKYKLGSHE